ncbi:MULTISPECIES: ABC transporter permease [Enterocloster]|uniref:Simple sugar transport system permease protein n=2 Tax=Enterocloster TaxID=2719313 RepID=A0A1I0K587_9FIRM|nr:MULTISPECIES: ABC transporter permease [Enterocloster]RHR55314.1 ABC transporter permease [Clostridium sp. AF18-27]MBS5605798.1 ABC transporter permease [Enterocloster asparagiformis]MCB6342830.1 ABC transporter permease [Enterocloster lavalensis]MDR3758877.1 ABC transporter permease [Enterocloster sp.]PST30484.1 ABC transporter permease [Enterocloster lavalensis]
MKKLNQTSFLKLPFLGDMAVSFGRTVFGIVLGLIASAVLIAISGVNPFLAYGALIRGAFGNAQALSNVLVRASPLLLGGIGVSLGIKAGVWNIGMEGYMYLGAIGASMVGILELGLPPFLHILICFLCAAAFSAVWGLIPGYLKAYKGVNEVTSTIMMSYIAIYLTNWVVSSFAPIAEIGKFYPMSKQFASTALLPILMKGSSLHPGPFLAILLCVIFYFILNYTSFGYRTKMLGANPNAAKYAGVDARKQIMLIIMIGAIIGGLSGAVEVMGLKRRVYMEFVTNVGYESVAVALLAGGNPLGVIFSALFFAALKAGGATMSIETGVISSMNSIIIATCMLFVIGVGVVDSRRLSRVVDNSKDDDDAEENVGASDAKEGN